MRSVFVSTLFAVVVGVATSESLPAQARASEYAKSGRKGRDSLTVARQARDLQAKFERQRRQMLPRFYLGRAGHCLIIGRFCVSHTKGANHAIPDEGDNIRRARARLLQELADAAAVVPGDEWIAGQRVRYLVEDGDTSAVHAARRCSTTRWWCDALMGYALHLRGDFFAADSAFALALAGMPSALRCHWINVSPLLETELRKTYRRLPCAEREVVVQRIWWLADPLWMTPGNERRTEHFSRVLHTVLNQKAVNTHGLSWGGDLAELIVRFGWPEKWTQDPSRVHTSGPVITGHTRDPGFRFFLTKWPPDRLGMIADSLWEIDQHPPLEQYSPRYVRAFVPLDAQVARFRRGDSTLFVAAFDVSADTLFRGRKFAAGLFATADEAAAPAAQIVAGAAEKQVMTVTSAAKAQLVGVEVLAADSSGAARWRAGFDEIPVDTSGISVSDLLFVDGAELPRNLDDATPRAHGGTIFDRRSQIGLFWELYGLSPTDSALAISLTISPLETGLLRSALSALRIAPKPTPLNIRWQDNGGSGFLSARSILLDLSLLPPGTYEVKLEAGPGQAARAARVIRIR